MKSTPYPSIIKNRIKVLLIFLLFVGLNACQQEEEFLPEAPLDESTVLLSEVKSWYEGAEKISLAAAPQWNDSWIKVAGEDAGIIKVPLKNSQFADSIYWDVLVQKQNGAIHALLVQVKVSPEYLAEKRKELGKASLPIRDYVENKDFTGEVYLYSLGGRFQMGHRFQGGTIVHQLHPLSSFKDLQARGRDIFSFAPPAWVDDDESGSGGSGTVDGGTLPGVVVTAPAYEGGSDQGDATWFIPSDRGSDFDDYYPSDPGMGEVPIGGGGGSSSSSPTLVTSDIIDHLTDPCFKSALNIAREGNMTGVMNEIISKLDGDNKIQVSVYQKSSLSGNVDGRTTNYNFVNGVFNADIYLSEAALKSASKEYVVGTILHESIHAYFTYMRGTDVFNAYSHETMALSYVEPLAKGLTDLFPNLTDEEAYGLAWGGLFGTVEAAVSEMKGQYKMGNTDKYMTRDDIQSTLNGHHFGIADNATTCE